MNMRSGVAIPGPGIANDAPSYNYAHLIGKRLLLRGCGENVFFDKALPRAGTVTRQLELTDWGRDWLELQFDEEFSYENFTVERCLIRGRWFGCPIGSDSAPVFILIDPFSCLTSGKDVFVSSDFRFESWGDVALE